MEAKMRYYQLLEADNGKHNEIELGEKMGLNEDETNAVIVELLSEHKIEYERNKASNYSVVRSSKKKSG